MFEPTRGGTRGGQAEFKWSDVSADKDREHYLGHSINAPTGRWQKNKDVHWYNRDKKDGEEERAEEIRKIKEAEAEALAAALGFAPTKKSDSPTGSNATPLGSSSKIESPGDAQKALEKDEKRKRRAERKEAKRAKKEARNGGNVEGERRRRRPSRSRSPKLSTRDDDGRRRSRSPPVKEPVRDDYDSGARERERERDRRRWESNRQREEPRRRRD